jgi:pimeloyl-ACP methyl ester carboxylesterase
MKVKLILLAVVLIFICEVSTAQFREEEVSFHNGDVTLSGTLSFPSTASKEYNAIILVSGSGPQNRDSEIFGFKPFKLLADFFNQNGYAVLRYDDRGMGKSTGKSVNESTTQDLAEDARQAFLLLSARNDIQRVGMLGHSEGGVVVPIVASKESDVAFLILMAGFGVKGVELSNAQQAAILRSSGMSEEFILAATTMNQTVMRKMNDSTVTEQQLSDFVKAETLKLLPKLPENIQSQIPDKEGYASMAAQQAVAQSKIPWIRYYMNYDPQPVLTKVKCPTLILFGELDTQVVASQNLEVMKNALEQAGNKNVAIVVVTKANHLFQESQTGSPTEYATLKKEFAPEFLEVIQGWLAKQK